MTDDNRESLEYSHQVQVQSSSLLKSHQVQVNLSDLELGPGDEPNRGTGFRKRYQPLKSVALMGSQIVKCMGTDGRV